MYRHWAVGWKPVWIETWRDAALTNTASYHVTNDDLPGDRTIDQVDWHASTTRLSNLATEAIRRVYPRGSIEFSYHDADSEGIALSSHGPVGPFPIDRDEESRIDDAISRLVHGVVQDRESWIIFKRDGCGNDGQTER